MLMRHIRTESWLVRRQVSFWLLTALLVILCSYACGNGIAWHQARAFEVATTLAQAAVEEAQERAELEALEQDRSALVDPLAGLPTAFGRHVILPPGPLSAFAIGQSDLYPFRTFITNWSSPDHLFRHYQLASPFSLWTGRFDFSFMLVYLVPLLLIAFTYDLVSAEREQGILELVLAQPIHVPQLVFARLAVRTLWIIGLISAITVLAHLSVYSGAYGERLLGWLLATAVYAVFWSALCALMISLHQRSESTILALVGCWIVVVLMLPAGVNIALHWLTPVPSRLESISARRAAAVARSEEEALADYRQGHPGFVLPEHGDLRNWIRAFVVHVEVDKRTARIDADYQRQRDRQHVLGSRLRFVSPALLLQGVLNDIAGSGLERQRYFVRQAEDFQRTWDSLLTDRLTRAERLTVAEYQTLPSFRYREEPSDAIAWRVAPALLALVAAAALLFLGAVRRLSRFTLYE